jgi:hypothetical protein
VRVECSFARYALFTYVSQQFAAPTEFDVVMAIGALVLVASIVLGGGGSATLTVQIAKGCWKQPTSREARRLVCGQSRRVGEYPDATRCRRCL